MNKAVQQQPAASQKVIESASQIIHFIGTDPAIPVSDEHNDRIKEALLNDDVWDLVLNARNKFPGSVVEAAAQELIAFGKTPEVYRKPESKDVYYTWIRKSKPSGNKLTWQRVGCLMMYLTDDDHLVISVSFKSKKQKDNSPQISFDYAISRVIRAVGYARAGLELPEKFRSIKIKASQALKSTATPEAAEQAGSFAFSIIKRAIGPKSNIDFYIENKDDLVDLGRRFVSVYQRAVDRPKLENGNAGRRNPD